MAPFLPVVAISRSQNVRIGMQTVQEMAGGNNPQTGALLAPTYVDLGDAASRRDLQRHSALGAVVVVGSAGSSSNDLYSVSGDFAVTNGTGLSVDVASGHLISRTFGTEVDVSGTNNLALATADPTNPRVDLVAVNAQGNFVAVAGTPAASGATAPAAPTGYMPVATVAVAAAATTPGTKTPDFPTS